MVASLPLLLAATLLTLLPYPATPKATRPLTSSEMHDILHDIRDVMDVLQDSTSTGDASLPAVPLPPADVLPSPLLRFPPGMATPGRLPSPSSAQHAEPSSDLSLVFPLVSSSENEEAEVDGSFVKRVQHLAKSDTPSSYVLDFQGRVKRGRSSLCHLLGFPMSQGCLQEARFLNVPQTRSGSALPPAQRKSSPSLYLFGGAIGR